MFLPMFIIQGELMSDKLRYTIFKEGQENIVFEMIWKVFSEFAAPDYSNEGIKTFKEFIKPQRLIREIKKGNLKIYCCFAKEKIVGVLAFRNVEHIALLFVDKDYQNKGIAKNLLKIGVNNIVKDNPNINELTVNSSPYAVKIYKKLGFVPSDNMQEKDGIKFMPMKKTLNNN